MSMAAIGIDIGGTKIAIARVCDGRIEGRQTVPVADLGDLSEAIETIRLCVGALVGGQAIAGIGVAAPGPLDCARGIIDSPETLPLLSGQPLVQLIEDACDLPVRCIHDATAAVIGEVTHGAGQGADSVVMLTLGTGVGAGIWQHGSVVQGHQGFAPELGHLPVGGPAPADGPCYCGVDACLENRCSGSAFDRDARSLGLSGSRELFAAAAAGDGAAQGLIDDAAAALARGIRAIAHAYAPQRIIIGGGQGSSEFAALTTQVERELAVLPMAPRPEVCVAALGNDAGLIGAAAIAG